MPKAQLTLARSSGTHCHELIRDQSYHFVLMQCQVPVLLTTCSRTVNEQVTNSHITLAALTRTGTKYLRIVYSLFTQSLLTIHAEFTHYSSRVYLLLAFALPIGQFGRCRGDSQFSNSGMNPHSLQIFIVCERHNILKARDIIITENTR